MRDEDVEALDAGRHPTGGNAGDLGDLAERGQIALVVSGSCGETSIIGQAVRMPHEARAFTGLT